jgi:PTS system beta-glucosides-specific IIC component
MKDYEELVKQILPLLGGSENVSRQEANNGKLIFTVKDGGMVNTDALCGLKNVADASVNRGRVRITTRDNLENQEISNLNKKGDLQMATKNYEEIATQIIAKTGGKENIEFATHCMTRLRLTLKDREKVTVDDVKKISGVLGAQFSGTEFQVIIGQDVPKLYEVFCKKAEIQTQKAVDENLDAGKSKEAFSLKKLGGNIMSALTGCLSPLIPVMIVAGMLKMLAAVLGDMTGLISTEGDLYTLFTFVGDAGFYYFPVMIGYTGAKKFGCNPLLGIFMGGVLLHPTFLNIVSAGESFTVFGIPVTLASYSSSVLPMILITWAMSYVEKFFKKYVPDILSTVFVPLLTIFVMLPLGLCVLAPLGTILATGVTTILNGIYNVAGPLGVAIIGALWIPLVAFGMHLPLVSTVLVSYASLGYDAIVTPGLTVSIYSLIALDLAFSLKAKTKEEKSLGISCLLSQVLGGVGEPGIFGILLRYKKALAWCITGAFCGSLVVGILGAKGYVVGLASNVLCATAYGTDIGKGIVGCAVGFVVSFALMMVFGYQDKGNGKV